jgi:hypothetical protein
MTRFWFGALFALVSLAGCASLGSLRDVLQPPRMEAAAGRQAELRLLPPGTARPQGGAVVRLWARVENPNAVGLTLAAVNGSLALEGRPAARVDFPLGIPLPAGRDTVIPLEVGLDFGDLPGLADLGARAITGGSLGYRLNGTIAVDAGLLGQPRFGPLALMEGRLQVRR